RLDWRRRLVGWRGRRRRQLFRRRRQLWGRRCQRKLVMKPKHFIEKLDDSRIVAAIAAAEQKSSGEIRVYVSHKKRHNALEAAKARFRVLEMHKTKDRNAVLIYLVPHTQQFALWGDIAVHEKCGEDFWKEVAAAMSPMIKQGL